MLTTSAPEIERLTAAVRAAAVEGRVDECRVLALRGFELAAHDAPDLRESLSASLGLLELGRGDAQAAVDHLAHATLSTDYVEALARSGRLDAARQALEPLAREAATPAEHAACARCRGLVESEFERCFDEALAWHALNPDPFECARTLLSLGERLRRARRRADSRPPLRAALETFERLGASGWAARACAELAASGETRRPEAPLTPQERQIAALAAQGLTNKELGARLFLSPKTIETHLTRIYRKLAVRSRTELAALLAAAA